MVLIDDMIKKYNFAGLYLFFAAMLIFALYALTARPIYLLAEVIAWAGVGMFLCAKIALEEYKEAS